MLEQIWKKTLRREGVSVWSILVGPFWILSLFYEMGAWINRHRPRTVVRVNVPVISIGNIAVGGSGKTPLVMAFASDFVGRGYRVGIVSSGYGRDSADSITGRGEEICRRSVSEVGDETLLLAEQLPEVIFSIHPVKSEAARQLTEKSHVDLIIVDDGFQHFGLHRDLDIVAIDATTPPKWLHPLPFGILRDPLSALGTADIIAYTRANIAGDFENIREIVSQHNKHAKSISAHFATDTLVGKLKSAPVAYLKDKHVLLFAGIGQFDHFRRQVEEMSGTPVAAIELSDHQLYDEGTVARLRKAIVHHKPQIVLTTAKDWVKTRDFDFGPEFYYLELKVTFLPPEDDVVADITHKLQLVPPTR